MIKITIFEARTDNKKLKEIIRKQDNTVGQLGVGGYEVALHREQDGITIFTFTPRNFHPAPVHTVAIKENQIWVRELTSAIPHTLILNNIEFSVKFKQFAKPEQILPALSAS